MNNINIGSSTDKHGEPEASQPCLKPLGKIGIDQREEDNSGRVLDLGNHPIELGRGAHQRIDMFDRSDALILRRRGSRCRDQRFAGRVRDQMKVEVAAAQCGPRRSIATVITSSEACGQAWRIGPLGRKPSAGARRGAFDEFTAVPIGTGSKALAKMHMNCGDN